MPPERGGRRLGQAATAANNASQTRCVADRRSRKKPNDFSGRRASHPRLSRPRSSQELPSGVFHRTRSRFPRTPRTGVYFSGRTGASLHLRSGLTTPERACPKPASYGGKAKPSARRNTGGFAVRSTLNLSGSGAGQPTFNAFPHLSLSPINPRPL
jgi:hypothetical protein